ncbi:MAG: hypothetical protein ACRDSN_06245 [Pseudonocardiaceae bacterium]
MSLAREFDDLVGQVRALDGFEHLLAPTPFTQLRAAAVGGPVVIVNTSRRLPRPPAHHDRRAGGGPS